MVKENLKNPKEVGEFFAQHNSCANYEDIKGFTFPRMESSEVAKMHPEAYYYDLFDMKIAIEVVINADDDQITGYRITHNMIDRWSQSDPNLTKHMLSDAVENAEARFPANIEPLSEVLGIPDDANPFFILTNQLRNHGASTMIYNKVISDFYLKRDREPFYIIPSSVHEVLLVPVSIGITEKDVKKMLCEVNQDVVSSEEVLSNHPMYYDGNLSIIV